MENVTQREELVKKAQMGEITPTELWKGLKTSWESMSAEEKARDKARAETACPRRQSDQPHPSGQTE